MKTSFLVDFFTLLNSSPFRSFYKLKWQIFPPFQILLIVKSLPKKDTPFWRSLPVYTIIGGTPPPGIFPGHVGFVLVRLFVCLLNINANYWVSKKCRCPIRCCLLYVWRLHSILFWKKKLWNTIDTHTRNPPCSRPTHRLMRPLLCLESLQRRLISQKRRYMFSAAHTN